jgi:hypothetical protein
MKTKDTPQAHQRLLEDQKKCHFNPMELIEKLAIQKTEWSIEEQTEAFKEVYQISRLSAPEKITVKAFLQNLNKIKK